MVPAMAFDLLPALRPRMWRATIRVRVCRKWEYRGGTDDGPIQHVDLVLLDEKGNSLYAEIPEQDVEAKSPLIEENGVYVISRFRVSNAKSGYRPVDSQYMVEFTLHTTISALRTPMPGFPMYAYRITPINELASHAGDTRHFIDTIGVLVEVSDTYTVHLPNKPAPTLTRHIILRDLSYSEMKVTLWGQRAAAFNTDGVYNNAEAKPVIVLFVGGLMKSYQGTYYLSANTTSRWYFNPTILEAHQFYDSFQNQKLEIRSVPAPADQQDQLQVPAQREEKTLRQLNEMDPYDFAENGYRCTVTIGRLLPNASWWFPSCNRCSKTCVPDGAGYRCNACSTTAFRFKYKLCFIALDGTDEAEMICFGDVARRIIGKPVQQVLRTTTRANTYPPDIVKMVSLRFTFAVCLTQQSYYRQQKTYQVVSVVTSHGNQPAAPLAIEGAHGGEEAGQEDDQEKEGAETVAAASDGQIDHLSPAAEVADGPSSPLLQHTPPPTLDTHDTPTVKGQASVETLETVRPSARKRLLYEDSDVDQSAVKDFQGQASSTGKLAVSNEGLSTKGAAEGATAALDNKRSCRSRAPLQESG